ncbi:MAG: tyrosine-type recombinase/integrase, partial [Candidatus Pacearchaeota archaeon]|nr:tyrosine-type recombinase/integrase [Candidatus Pacearchaeota archaeon]
RADKSNRIGAVKSKAGRRTIYLPRKVIDILNAWKKNCPKSELNLVFPTSEGKPQVLTSITRGAWYPLMKRAGLVNTTRIDGKEKDSPKYTLNSLRHYFASKLIEKGTDFKIIQETMGHSTIELTFNVYGHLLKDREEKRKAIAEELMADISSTEFVLENA